MKLSKSYHRTIIYILAFVFTLHVTPGTYINSSFIEQFVGPKGVGLVIALGSLFTLVAFFFTRPVLSKYGNYKTFTLVLFLELIALLILSIATLPGFILVSAYILGFIMRSLAFFHLDIFLEEASDNKSTGGIRGIYLTIMNISFLIGPLLAGFVIQDAQYWKVYLISSIILLPSIYIVIRYLRDFKDPTYERFDFKTIMKAVHSQIDLRSAFSIQALLRFFYSWMIIYTPIYLVQTVGFTIADTTKIIAIALIAFVLLQGFLGYIADKYIGEKEILITGFLILSASTAMMSFIDSNSFWIWTMVLFMTRVGASMIEIMGETYFFKKIDSTDVSIIGAFRMTRPFIYVLSPLLGSLLLFIIDIKYLFLILGIFMLYGIRHALILHDTL